MNVVERFFIVNIFRGGGVIKELFLLYLQYHSGGLNHFIFFNSHFSSVNVFQGEGGVINELFLLYLQYWGDFDF